LRPPDGRLGGVLSVRSTAGFFVSSIDSEGWNKFAAKSKIFVDFSPKGGPKDVVGKWQDGGIVFPDGNKWSKIEQEVTTLVGKIGDK